MPLSEAELLDLQADAMADDVEIDLAKMSLWTAEQATAYFESGGTEEPAAAAVPKAASLRSGNYDRTQLAEAMQRLPRLGNGGATMFDEELGARRGCYEPRPEARLRLFTLYGIADNAMSTESWLRKAPAWLETRLVELPGHGFRSKEPLPPCSGGGALDLPALASQRAALAEGIADEIQTAAGEQPFALYGFSFGALLFYEAARILQARRARNLPLCLCVAGRGAPHVSTIDAPTLERIAAPDDEGMLSWMKVIGFGTDNIPAAMRSRAAALFRGGMLLGAMPYERVGEDGTATPECRVATSLPAGGKCFWEGGSAVHTDGAAPVSCPVLAVGSAADTTWPANLVARWADVAPDAPNGFTGLTLPDVPHNKLMNREEVMEAVWAEVAVHALTE